MTAHGPYEAEAQARADVDALHARAAAAGESDMRRAQVRALLDALARLGVHAGNFDQLILASIGQWEPTTTVVVLGLVERAHAAGRRGRNGERAVKTPEKRPVRCAVLALGAVLAAAFGREYLLIAAPVLALASLTRWASHRRGPSPYPKPVWWCRLRLEWWARRAEWRRRRDGERP